MSLEEDLAELCAANAFMKYNHIVLKSVERDRAVMELTVQDESLNPYGMVHGGALYTMGDCAAGTAARSNGRRYVTLASNLNFLRSGMPGDVIQAVGTVRRRGKTTCYVTVDISNSEGTLLASGNFTFFCIDEN
ncbi:MAG: PaaI family thioesterase [Clostridiales bacterium]|nr:PaaI family thioesterase [Clostridiales bacterium]